MVNTMSRDQNVRNNYIIIHAQTNQVISLTYKKILTVLDMHGCSWLMMHALINTQLANNGRLFVGVTGQTIHYITTQLY